MPRPHIAEQFPDLDEADGGAINRAVDTQQASPAMQESAATASAADKDSRQSGTLDDDAEGGFTGGATDAGLRGEEPTSGSPLDPGEIQTPFGCLSQLVLRRSLAGSTIRAGSLYLCSKTMHVQALRLSFKTSREIRQPNPQRTSN